MSGDMLPTDDYFVHDIWANWDLEDYVPNASLELRVNNLFDEAYTPVGSGIPEAGRDIRVGLRYRW